MRVTLLCVLALVMASVAAPEPDHADVEGEFFKLLSNVTNDPVAIVDPGAVRSAFVGATGSKPLRAFESATRLWNSHHWLELELAWLRQENTLVRRYILTLFYTQYGDKQVSIFPPFEVHIKRLNTTEAAQRQAELDWVLREKARIKPKIDALLGKQ